MMGEGSLFAAEVPARTLRFDRRRGDDQLQVRPLRQDPLEVAEDEVDVEAALMRLVDDDGVVFAQQWSRWISASRMPSVMSLTLVLRLTSPVKRTLKPTSWPMSTPSSSAMRSATVRAASRRGCVWPMRPFSPQPELQAHLRNLGGLTGTGLAGDDGHLVGRDGGHQVLAALGDRQLGGVGDMQCHGCKQSTGNCPPRRSGQKCARSLAGPGGAVFAAASLQRVRLRPVQKIRKV